MSEEGDNVVLSPISVALALALAENGASSETALAIAQAMQRGETGDAQQQAGDSPANDTLVDDLTQKLNEGNLALLRLLADAQATGMSVSKSETPSGTASDLPFHRSTPTP